jgi:Secretion system C-terminal sorting domain
MILFIVKFFVLLVVNILQPTELHAQNEKIINEIYFTTVAKGNLDYTESQKATLSDIAQQCPIVGGRSVYTARAMYATVANINYNDITACALQNINFRTVKPKETAKKVEMTSGFAIAPNPASTYAILKSTQALSDDAQVSLYDIYGRCVSTTVVAKGAYQANINTSDLVAGIYMCKITANDTTLFVTKLSIIN